MEYEAPLASTVSVFKDRKGQSTLKNPFFNIITIICQTEIKLSSVWMPPWHKCGACACVCVCAPASDRKLWFRHASVVCNRKCVCVRARVNERQRTVGLSPVKLTNYKTHFSCLRPIRRENWYITNVLFHSVIHTDSISCPYVRMFKHKCLQAYKTCTQTLLYRQRLALLCHRYDWSMWFASINTWAAL